ncbi:MAG: RNA polymerase sigma factor (sigma-70 family) [Planctomycetota bacterium]|jgi:RNA polymerase sigma factor (sigma-70 family)
MTNPQADARELQTLDLVRLAQQGHDEAMNEIFARYSDRVRKIVGMRLGKGSRLDEDSGDILQMAFADAFKGLDRLTMHDESSLLRWLATIVKNRILESKRSSHAARRDRRLEVPIEAPNQDGEVRSLPLLANLRTPSMEVGRAEEAGTVRDCIASLPEKYSEVIIQRDYVQSSWAEIAEELDFPSPDAARALYDRGLNKLGAELRRRGIG